jgi:hypothetical protein
MAHFSNDELAKNSHLLMWINMAYTVGTQIQQQTPHPFHYHLFYYLTQISFSLYKNLLPKIHSDGKDDCIM